jgi:DoxX-like family
MFLATIVICLLLAALLSYAAVRKLGHSEPVVQSYARVGVPEDKLDCLAAILFAGAAGLTLGLVWAPIGVAAAIGVIAYFVLAVASHIRAGDTENLPTPAAILVIAVSALVLRSATL